MRDPVSMSALKPEGEEKPKNSYWMRRLMVGDAVLVTESKPTPEPNKESDSKPKPKKTYTRKKAQDEKKG